MKGVILILLILTLSVSLLNSNFYGESSLTALFQFWLLSSLTSLVVFIFLGLKIDAWVSLPNYLATFLILTIYVIIQGVINGSFGLTKYYWICCCLFLLSTFLFAVKFSSHQNSPKSTKDLLYSGIAIISFLEALVVLLQYATILPSPTKLFRSTGTWLNPNVSAMFLALSLHAFNYVFHASISKFKRVVVFFMWVSVLFSILILFSRTAIIVALILIVGGNLKILHQQLSRFIKINKRILSIIVCLAISSAMIIMTVSIKERSTLGRLHVWENAIGLIIQRPLTGYGFDDFERQINLFATIKNGTGTGHVNMAYNDFLEIGVEGGILSIGLWILFYVSLARLCVSRKIHTMYSLLFSFLIIQVSNFGFQAIPVFVLFLLFTAVETGFSLALSHSIHEKSRKNWISKVVFFVLCFVTSINLINTFKVSSAFYKKNEIVKNSSPNQRLNGLLSLSNDLVYYSSFQEAVGDQFLESKNYEMALDHYLKAIRLSSFPNLYTKAGYCYQVLERFDSSKKEYLLVQRMEPEKLGPHLSLLKMYHQKKDTLNILSEAEQIVNKPVRIMNKRSIEIKQYADSVIKVMKNTLN